MSTNTNGLPIRLSDLDLTTEQLEQLKDGQTVEIRPALPGVQWTVDVQDGRLVIMDNILDAEQVAEGE